MSNMPLTPKEKRLRNGVKKWASFYKANPHRFVEDYLKIKLHLFQKILIYMCFHVDYTMYLAARGQGKSWLIAVIVIIRCILYPNSKIIIASGTKGQAKLIITQKIKDFKMRYPMVDREILDIKSTGNECIVYFRNGSSIEAVTSTDNSRGYRGNFLILDEFRMIKEDILKKVLKPFLNVNRQPPYLMNPEFMYLQEENKEIYISSAWYKSHWSWLKFKSFLKSMTRSKNTSFACGLNYQLSLHHGILTQKKVDNEMNADDFDPIAWGMEMDCIFWGENSKSYFKLDDLQKNRILTKPFYPTDNRDFLQNKKKLKTKKNTRLNGEIRIVGVDTALMGGLGNDNSVFTLIRLIPTSSGYERQVVYIEHMNGEHTTIQAIRLKQLFYDFEADWIAMDTQGNSMSLFDDLVKVLYDTERDIEYPAWTCINNEKMADRALEYNAIPVIYSYKAANNTSLNHEIAMSLRNCFQKGKIKLLVNHIEGMDYLSEKPEFENASDEIRQLMLKPYIQTTSMVNEIINLEYTVGTGLIKVYEVGRNRKDRYSSLGYANHLADELEINLKNENCDPDDDIVYY